MVSLLRLAHPHISAVRSCLHRCAPTRSIAFSASRASELAPDPPEERLQDEVLAETEQSGMSGNPDFLTGQEERPGPPRTYRQFMDEIGHQFKHSNTKNWLGRIIQNKEEFAVPFPMNPSFRPPPPLSDAQKETIYRQYMEDPEQNNIRNLSQRYHISLKRVDAILRLKGLEKAWIKGKQLQTGFEKGMEKLLGVKTDGYNANDAQRYDVQQADDLEEIENRDATRQKYQRLYWESTSEDGREPIVPASLEHAKKRAKKAMADFEKLKTSPKLMPRLLDSREDKMVVREREGRPTIRFVDVGAKFMDVDERLKRIARARRHAIRKEYRRSLY